MARRPRRDPREDRLLEELGALYGEADALFSDHRCETATECCRFGVTGREPYLTSIELALVKRAIAARGGPLAARRRALPLAPRGRDDERTCPMLDASARCSIYRERPLGCRTYFCHRATADGKVPQRAINALVRRIQELASRHERGGDVGRPLSRAL